MSKRLKNKGDKVKISTKKLGEKKDDYPVFCFRHLQTRLQNGSFCIKFIDRLQKLSSLSWGEIGTSARHSFGMEKIPTDQIKPNLPNFITPDVKSLFVFRATGDNHAFLGLRNDNVFHIIFIEESFGDVYNH